MTNPPLSFSSLLLASAVGLASLPAQEPKVEMFTELDGAAMRLEVHGAEAGADVLLVGYVSASGSSEEITYLSGIFGPLQTVSEDEDDYTAALSGLGVTLEPPAPGTSFSVPASYVGQTIQAFLDEVAAAGAGGFAAAAGELAQKVPAPSPTLLHWDGAPSVPAGSPPYRGGPVIPWSELHGEPTTFFANEALARGMVANQFTMAQPQGSPPVGVNDPKVEYVMSLITEEYPFDYNVQALVLDGSVNPPRVRVSRTRKLRIVLSGDPGQGRQPIRFARGEGLPFLYPGMPGLDLSVELNAPVASAATLEQYCFVFPAIEGLVLRPVDGTEGSRWVICHDVPLNSVSGRAWVLNLVSGLLLPLHTPNPSAPERQFEFWKIEPDGN